MDRIHKRFGRARLSLPARFTEATHEAMVFLIECAQRILDIEVYEKERPPFAPRLTYELYNSFVVEVMKAGASATGLLANTSEHAIFLEFGTDDEGTGKHFIPLVSAGALHWVNPMTGQSMFSKGHWVQGIKPIHFMERALSENRAGVAAIYRKSLEGLFT
jgi:hypothetical protein